AEVSGQEDIRVDPCGEPDSRVGVGECKPVRHDADDHSRDAVGDERFSDDVVRTAEAHSPYRRAEYRCIRAVQPLFVDRERSAKYRPYLKQWNRRSRPPCRGDTFGSVAAALGPDVGVARSIEADVGEPAREALVGEVDSERLLYASELRGLEVDADEAIRLSVGQGPEK